MNSNQTMKMKKNRIRVHEKRTPKEWVALWIIFVIFAIYAITLIFPFVWMLLNSFKGTDEFYKDIWSLPKQFDVQNYSKAMQYSMPGNIFGIDIDFTLPMMFLVSIVITFLGTAVNILFSCMAAYVVAKYKFPGRGILYSIAIFTMIVPVVGTLPSQYRIVQTLKLYDSVIGLLILYSGAFGFNFFMLHGFFKNISWTYAEAAFMDGANDFQVFFKIMLPLAKPSIVALAIVHAIGLWNDYVTPSIYLKSIPTLAVGIEYLTSEMKATVQYPAMFATMIISMVPILIVFIIFQKTIMENTVAGGIKG